MVTRGPIWCICLAICAWAANAAAQTPPTNPGPRVVITTNSAVVRQHRPGTWSVLAVNAVNRTDEEGEGLVSIFFPPDAGRQYARRVWVPPRAVRMTWLPFRFPGGIPQQVERQNYTALALDPSSPREVLQRRAGDPMTSDHLVGVNHSPVKTATLLNLPARTGELEVSHIDRDAWDTLMAGRVSLDLDESANDLYGDFMPPWSQALQGFDQFLLTSDRITRDAGGLNALRAWVRDGGRLWLTLDTLSPETVAAILGNAGKIEVVDQVELDKFTIHTVDPTEEEPLTDDCDFEVPVKMLRVVTSSTSVPCHVNGWPAAFAFPYGEGEILCTTLGVRGWRPEFSKSPTKGLKYLAARMFVGRDGRLDVKEFRPSVEQRIGYQVPSRSVPFTLLGGFWLVLLGGVVAAWRRRRVESLTWFVPLAALLAGGTLVGVGMRSSHRVPPSVAHFELVRISPDTSEATVDGLAALYDQQTRPVEWQGHDRFLVTPDPTADAEVRREIWTDNDTIVTQNATARAGSIGLTSITGSRPLNARIICEGQFGPDGFMATLATPGLKDVSDAVILNPPAGTTGVKLSADGKLVAGPDQVLAADQFLADALLTDEQSWRQELMRRLLVPTDAYVFPKRASLAFWCQANEPAVHLPEGFDARGSSLVVMPLEINRTPTKTPFRIPSTFLGVTSVSGKTGRSTSYNPRTGQWVKGLTTASETVLRFQLPSQVQPCQLERGTLTIKLNAPSRNLVISSYRGGELKQVRTETDPNGTLQIALTAEDLQIDERGGVRISVAVTGTHEERASGKTNSALSQPLAPSAPGQPPKAAATAPAASAANSGNSTWQIDYVRLTVDGQTL